MRPYWQSQCVKEYMSDRLLYLINIYWEPTIYQTLLKTLGTQKREEKKKIRPLCLIGWHANTRETENKTDKLKKSSLNDI